MKTAILAMTCFACTLACCAADMALIPAPREITFVGSGRDPCDTGVIRLVKL